MDLTRLEYFIVLSEELNYHRAADRLFISQPSLSAQIHKLEREVDCKLFKRVGRNIQLSTGGKALIPRAKEILLQVRNAENELAVIGGNERTVVNFGVSGYHLIMPLLKKLTGELPQARFSIREYATVEIIEKILSRELDIGFSYLPMNQDNLEVVPLVTDELVAVVKKGGQYQAVQHFSIQELSQKPLAVMKTEFYVRQLVDTVFKKKRLAPYYHFETVNFQSCLAIVERTDDIGIVSQDYISSIPPEIVQKNFKVVDLLEPFGNQNLGLIYRNDVPFDDLLKKFVHLFTEYYHLEKS